jgi:hypothetical protein
VRTIGNRESSGWSELAIARGRIVLFLEGNESKKERREEKKKKKRSRRIGVERRFSTFIIRADDALTWR